MARNPSKPAGGATSKRKSSGATGARRSQRKKGEYSLWREIGTIVLNLLGILLGLLIVGLCIGFWYGTTMMEGIMQEIGQKDISQPIERKQFYDKHFDSLRDSGLQVVAHTPKVVEGVTTYRWTVKLQNSGETRDFSWKHNLGQKTLEPMTNEALVFDVDNGFISPETATTYDFYDPSDKTAHSIAQMNLDESMILGSAGDWEEYIPQEGEVLPPLISVQEGLEREGAAEAELLEQEEEERAEEDEDTQDDAIRVGAESPEPPRDR